MNLNLKSIKLQMIIFLVGFAVFLFIKDRDTAFLFAVLVAVFSALGFEIFINYLKNKNFAFLESAVVSGLIIALVLSSDAPWWIFVSASFVAIASKYLIRFNKKHIFNPAAFAIFLITIIFGVYTQWRGAYHWYVLVPAGIYFIFKIRKLELLFSFFITAIILFGAQAWVQKVPLANIFGYLNYFFIFIMLIEPRTTPIIRKGKIIFGIEAACLVFILTFFGTRLDIELLSLLIANATVPFLNKVS